MTRTKKAEHKNARLAKRIKALAIENHKLRMMLKTYAEQLIELGEEYRALRDLLNPEEWRQREYEALFAQTEKQNGNLGQPDARGV